MISLTLASRIEGNPNWGLFHLLDSLEQLSYDYANFEVCIKFDDDDKEVPNVILELKGHPFPVKYLVEPRGRGYRDVHVFYNRLLTLVDERSEIIAMMPDDFEVICEGWDKKVLDKTRHFFGSAFTVHAPGSQDGLKLDKLDLDLIREAKLAPDMAPMWSRKFLDICNGFHFTAFTDLWTLQLEHVLLHKHGISRAVILDEPISRRKITSADGSKGLRWNTVRRETLDFMASDFYRQVLEQQALNIVLNDKHSARLENRG